MINWYRETVGKLLDNDFDDLHDEEELGIFFAGLATFAAFIFLVVDTITAHGGTFDHLTDLSTIGNHVWLLVGSIPAFLVILMISIDTMHWVLNRYGNIMYGDDWLDLEYVTFKDCGLRYISFQVFYRATLMILAMSVAFLVFNIWVGIIIGGIVLVEVLTRIFRKVRDLNIKLKQHIADKDAHKGESE